MGSCNYPCLTNHVYIGCVLICLLHVYVTNNVYYVTNNVYYVTIYVYNVTKNAYTM